MKWLLPFVSTHLDSRTKIVEYLAIPSVREVMSEWVKSTVTSKNAFDLLMSCNTGAEILGRTPKISGITQALELIETGLKLYAIEEAVASFVQGSFQ